MIKAISNKQMKVYKNNRNIYSKYNTIRNKEKIKSKKISSPNTNKKFKLMNIPVSKKSKKKNFYNRNTYDSSSDKKRNIGIEKLTSNNNTIKDFSDFNLNENIYYKNVDLSNTINVDSSSITNLNNNFYNYEEKLNILSNGTKQSNCYYRVYNKDNIEINLLEINSQNLEIFGYSDGFISIDLNADILKFTPKAKTGNELWIYLKSIIGIKLEQYMINIKKIHEIFENDSDNNKSLNINNLLQKKEFIEIPIEQNEKIKAALSNNFAFYIIINDVNEVKIECVFNNFQNYIFWMDYLEKIMEYHNVNNNLDNNNNNNIFTDELQSI